MSKTFTRADLYGAQTTEILLHRKLIERWVIGLADSDLGTVEYWLGVMGKNLGISMSAYLPLGRVLLLYWWLERGCA